MTELLEDELNLKLLQEICSGNGVEVNISQLAKKLNKHRKTIKDRVNRLFENNIISKPPRGLSVDEVEELTENVQYALIDFYRQTIDDSIRDAKPHGIWEKVKALFRS